MPHPKLHAARYRKHSLAEVETDLHELIGASAEPDEVLRERIQGLVETYTPGGATESNPAESCEPQEQKSFATNDEAPVVSLSTSGGEAR